MKSYFIKLIKKYQRDWSPKLQERGVKCLFDPSCSNYAIHTLNKYWLLKAVILIIYRLLSCNPINAHLKSRKLLIK